MMMMMMMMTVQIFSTIEIEVLIRSSRVFCVPLYTGCPERNSAFN